jgi:hypothetical protein
LTGAQNRLLCVSFLLAALALSHNAWADPPHTGLCSVCHSNHGASYPTQVSQLCEGCHFEGGPALAVETHSSLTSDNGYGNWHVDCWGCHDPHTQHQDRVWGTNYGMYLEVELDAEIIEVDPNDPGPFYEPLSIIATVSSSNVEHTSSTGFVDGDAESSDDICQVCHESTNFFNPITAFNYHDNLGSETQPGGDCMQCHPHESGFAPTGGSCISCHAQAQGSGGDRRQVAGVGGDFERISHHVTDGSATEIVTEEDCIVCHNQGNHQSNAEPQVVLNDPDLGAALTYAYDGSGASIENFCVNCHDADASLAFDSDSQSSDGYQPFSDGRDPQDIATGWAGSSHNTSPVAALADEACMACHGGADSTRSGLSVDPNAHGSDLPSMLSDTIAGKSVTNTEEALCFACHDGAVALSDVQAEFASAALYTDSSDALVNSHHDVSDADQSYSGAVIECLDCHVGPHEVSASNKLLVDPDTSDGVTPVAGYSWAGSTWLSEWCLDCHDGSYPASVTAPTNPLVNIATDYPDPSNQGDQHGANAASNKVELRAGSGYQKDDILECSDCHNLGHGDDASGTVYPNLFNLKSIVYSKDGSTPLTPDTSWDLGNPNVVRLTDASSANTDANTNGKAWCSTCHENPMGGTKNSGCLDGNCHHHGTNSF